MVDVIVRSADAWKLVLAIALGAGILLSASAHAPRRAISGAELRRLAFSALLLYAVGGLASFTGHPILARLLFAAGILTCALAAWLSRGTDSGGPPGRERPVDERPPPQPDGAPELDWEQFEREFAEYARRQRDPAGTR